MRVLCACLVCAMAVPALAGTEVIATFDDPAAGGSTPLFTFNGLAQELSASWTLPGLTLDTISGTFDDVTINMNPIPVDGFGETGAGQVVFKHGPDTIFTVDFDSAQLVGNLQFGATEFLATNIVMFSGSILTAPTEMESFAFAFANQEMLPGNGFSATASFTSSAAVIPEPSSVAVLGLAGAFRRRRAKSRAHAGAVR